jgi:branched-chain amino acid transport system substrate-binding protein
MSSTPNLTRRAGLALMAAPLLARADTLTSDITVGALLSLTGGWATLGQTSRALLEMAVADMNTFLSSAGAQGRVRLRVEDTRLDANACVNSLRVLTGAGANMIIGPQSSSEAGAIRPLLAGSNAFCISQGSTASTLSLPGDNLFRWVPDDALEAEALVAMVQAAGIRTLVPCWRADAGNRGLATAVRRLFQAAGGTVTDGLEYSTDTPNFTDIAARISGQVVTSGGRTAVYLAAFDEVVDLFRAATAVPGLSSINWYGSDGVAFSVPLATDAVAADFAVKTNYANPTLLRSDSARAKWEPLVKAVTESTKIEPDAFALAAYDAFWCGMTARLLAGSNDLIAWKRYITFTAENFFGATGWGRLNANGDRAFGDFEFWALRNHTGTPQWTSIAKYDNGLFATATQTKPPRLFV